METEMIMLEEAQKGMSQKELANNNNKLSGCACRGRSLVISAEEDSEEDLCQTSNQEPKPKLRTKAERKEVDNLEISELRGCSMETEEGTPTRGSREESL